MASGWQAYIKNLIDNAPAVIKKAAIIGVSDGNIWARSEPPVGEVFNANPQELQTISQLFQGEGYKDTPAKGIYVEGVKYIVPRVEENLVFGKKDKSGVFLVKTNQAVIIALYVGDTSEGLQCRSAVERVAQYLQGQGYWKNMRQRANAHGPPWNKTRMSMVKVFFCGTPTFLESTLIVLFVTFEWIFFIDLLIQFTHIFLFQ